MQSSVPNQDGQNFSASPPSKLLAAVRSQHQRPLSSCSSGSSEDTGGSDSSSTAELRLSRYVTRVPESGADGSRALPDGIDRPDFKDALGNGHNVDGGIPMAGSYGSREDGYMANGLGSSLQGNTGSAMSGYTNSFTSTSTMPTYGAGTSSSAVGTSTWSSNAQPRPREGSTMSVNTITLAPPLTANGSALPHRPSRPGMGRTPSHAYAPPRRPSQYHNGHSSRRTRSSSGQRRLNPDADYRAQKKAYAARLKQDNPDEDVINEEAYPPSLGYSTGSDTEEESPTTASYVDEDPFDHETQLMFGNDEMTPSAEELKIPANRERLEWHSMLANVLTGDVVRQEKKRMTGATDAQDQVAMKYDIWVGVRSKVCGRPLAMHKRLLDEQRAKAPTMIEDIISFTIKGEAEVGKTPIEQVSDCVNEIEKVHSLYPTTAALEKAYVRAASLDFKQACAAVISWQDITEMIETELRILRAWVGNEELDFQKSRQRTDDSNLTDESSFIDRLLKEDGLKSLQGNINPDPKKLRRYSMLDDIGKVIQKVKSTLIENSNIYVSKHLPPYIEELLTLINFPSRLVQEIIRMRLIYAEKIKDQAQQGVMIAEQMISQFQILLKLAVDVKEAYSITSQPEPGWDLPPCVDEKFDEVVLSAFRFYFKMLGWKISAGKNSTKEAEILEQEWSFLSTLARHFDGADAEVAEQFARMTARSLGRLTSQFQKELKRQPDEGPIQSSDIDRRYRQMLDSVRVRQRKLFRFTRQLTNLFENAAEYSINMPPHQLQEFYDNLSVTRHSLINVSSSQSDRIFVIASPVLEDRPSEMKNLLGTCYRDDGAPEDPTNPYVLILYPEQPIYWSGITQDVDVRLPKVDLKTGRLRLVAYGGRATLLGQKLPIDHAKTAFSQYIGFELDVLVFQKSNHVAVDHRLQHIRRTAYQLSDAIMESVDLIRRQLAGLPCEELIQACFAFATEFGQRSVMYMDHNRRALNNIKLLKLALDWISFICDDCVAADRKTFRYAVTALEFAMTMTRGQNILSINDSEYGTLRSKVAGCMSLLISHFDIMGARSSAAAQAEKQRMMDGTGGKFRLDMSKLKDDDESSAMTRERWMAQLQQLDEERKIREAEHKPLGRVLEDTSEADRSLTVLSAAATNVTHRWQQGQYIGGGTFGSVYVATNLDTGSFMAVKEIRLHDPHLIPTIAAQIKDEMGVLQILDHPNIVSYYGIEVHRDKVYIFMEYCSGGSFANLLEHGRIEDETVIMVYALQMLEGLAYLHESGVVHRDIKPDNILLDHNGVVKYVDFGAARVIARQTGRTLAIDRPGSASHPQNGGGKQPSMTGTPMYMSPEVIRGNTSFASGGHHHHAPARHGAADIWSLGCVVLEMATGRRPWGSLDNEWAIMYNIAQGNPPQLPTRDQLSDSGIDFLKRCFERDASKRATAAELLQHDWIMRLRNQLSLEPQTPVTPSSDGSSTPGSGTLSRQPTGMSG